MLRYVLYLINGNHHSQYPKNYKTEKLRKEMEGDTEDSTFQSESNIELILL